MVEDRTFGRMVALYENRLRSVPFIEVANKTRTVRPDSPMVAAAVAVGTSFGVPDLDVALEGDAVSGAVS